MDPQAKSSALKALFIVLTAAGSLISLTPCLAQYNYSQTNNSYRSDQFPQTKLEHLLNQVDSGWQAQQASAPGQPVQQANQTFNYAQRPFMGQQNAYNNMQNRYPNSGPGFAAQNYPYQPNNLNQFAPMGGMRQALPSGPPPFSKQSLLRIFLSGGSPTSGANPQNNAEKQAHDASVTGQAEALLQRARDQAAQAESDAERARYGDDKGARLGAASSAQYHANDARSAADTAASITYGASQYAQDYAAQARNAANRAQAAADRAQYNASN